jgi:hypothetical protein
MLIALIVLGCGGASEEEKDKAISAAHVAYQRAEKAGIDLGRGPCIAEDVPRLDDWVVDVAHDPRQAVDDDPDNQCRRYREGDAHHFVELTPQGEVIRAE